MISSLLQELKKEEIPIRILTDVCSQDKFIKGMYNVDCPEDSMTFTERLLCQLAVPLTPLEYSLPTCKVRKSEIGDINSLIYETELQ